MSLLVGHRNQATVISVKKPTISIPKRQGNFAQMWRASTLSLLTFAKLCITDLFSKDKPQTNITTSTPYDIYGEKVDKNYLKCGIQAIGITGNKIYWYRHDSSKTAGCTCKASISAHHKMLQMVLQPLGCCGHFQGDNTKLKVSLCRNSIQKQTDHTTHHTKSIHTDCWWLKQAFKLSNTQHGSRLVCRLGV